MNLNGAKLFIRAYAASANNTWLLPTVYTAADSVEDKAVLMKANGWQVYSITIPSNGFDQGNGIAVNLQTFGTAASPTKVYVDWIKVETFPELRWDFDKSSAPLKVVGGSVTASVSWLPG